ncbi:hypothetical protein [Nostoc sp.]
MPLIEAPPINLRLCRNQQHFQAERGFKRVLAEVDTNNICTPLAKIMVQIHEKGCNLSFSLLNL